MHHGLKGINIEMNARLTCCKEKTLTLRWMATSPLIRRVEVVHALHSDVVHALEHHSDVGHQHRLLVIKATILFTPG